MQQDMGSTASDNLLIIQWESCRLIGIINKVYFIFTLFKSIIETWIIKNNCHIFEYNISTFQNTCAKFNKYPVMTEPIFWILMILVYAVFIKMVFVNDDLRSTSIPINGKKVKTWLLYHYGYLGICILCVFGLLTDPTVNIFELIFYTILCIGLIIELNVVKKFKKEFEISADHYNRGVQISNI